ncbi:flippase [Clostridium sp. C8-1-8]|uniref:flippase n=1 Tax=Clostridium sp. C8-1-8 TaxID=2698831 RepID=UPI001371C814|nr:flippase [Clostridium sp. C8-1-8]
MSKSLVKNFMYNLVFQMVTLFIPLITVPYTSRILGKQGIGIYSYTLSIVQYFIIIGTVGISLYGNRSIAYVRDDKEKMSRVFWSITLFKFITTAIALIVYVIIFCINTENSLIYLIQSTNIVAAALDISWLYMGLEDFKKTVTRNLLIKLIGVACIFLFIKSYDDLYEYVAINGLMLVLGNLIMWAYVPNTVSFIMVTYTDMKQHFIPAIKLFIPQISVQIYAVLDRTMLGILSNTGEVGLYEQSQKIIRLVLGIVTSLGVVMLPRMSNTFSKGDNNKLKEYLNKSLKAIAYISIPMATGLAAISKELVPWFFGKDFYEVSYLLILSSASLVFIAIGNVLGMHYLLPSNRTREFTVAVTVGAISNVIINLLLIEKYKAQGACIATLISEFLVAYIQYLFIKQSIDGSMIINIVKYIVAAFFMFVTVRLIGCSLGPAIFTTFIQSIIGAAVYVIILVLLKEEINHLLTSIIGRYRYKLIKLLRK